MNSPVTIPVPKTRLPSLFLSLVLQLGPLLRSMDAGALAAPMPILQAIRWLAGIAVVGGSVHAVSGATGLTITQGGKSVKSSLGTNGVTFSGNRVTVRSDQFGNAQSYEFDGLPPGLVGNAQGVVTGIPTQPGDFPVTITGWQNSRFSGFSFTAFFNVTIVDAAPTAPPQVSVPPTAQSGPLDGTVTLSVTATGSGLSYQWIKDGQELPGATLATLVLSPLQVTDAGSYQVRVTNALGFVTTTGVSVSVQVPAPQLQPLPESVSLYAGEDFLLQASATGVEPLRYQWNLNGLPLVGETGPSLVRSPVDVSLKGAITVVVTYALGGIATGGPVAVVVAPSPVLRWSGGVGVLEATTIPGRSYRLESRASVDSGDWTEVTTTSATESVTRWELSLSSLVTAFWRVVVTN